MAGAEGAIRIHLVDGRDSRDIKCYNFALFGWEDGAAHAQLQEAIKELKPHEALCVNNVTEPIEDGSVLVWDGHIPKRVAWSDYNSGDDSDPDELNVNDGDEGFREVTSEAMWTLLRRNMNRPSHRLASGTVTAMKPNVFITLAALGMEADF